MKRNEIVNELIRISELAKAAEIKTELCSLIGTLRATAGGAPAGGLACFVHVNARVLDPTHTYPRQMLACHDVLVELGKDELTLAEVKDAIGANADKLATRQDPYRIYAFYQKRMEDEGWISRSKVRI